MARALLSFQAFPTLKQTSNFIYLLGNNQQFNELNVEAEGENFFIFPLNRYTYFYHII